MEVAAVHLGEVAANDVGELAGDVGEVAVQVAAQAAMEDADGGLGEVADDVGELAGDVGESNGQVAAQEDEPPFMMRLRFRDGSELLIAAARLAAMCPGFIFHFPQVENDRVYRLVQTYFILRDLYAYPVGEAGPLPAATEEEALLNVIQDVGVDEDAVHTLGHLARAAISLNAVDLMGMCVARLHELPVTPQIESVLMQIEALINRNPLP